MCRYALTIISKGLNEMMQKSTILRVKKCHFHYDMQKNIYIKQSRVSCPTYNSRTAGQIFII
jgi:hypothetical protein